MFYIWLFTACIKLSPAFSATIAIIDTGFDLDHDFLQPKILKQETDEENLRPEVVKEFHGWNFHDNSHLKKPVIEDSSTLQEILLYRSLRAKGHREGLSIDEFEWFKKRSADKKFMKQAKNFKKHSHGTFVAGIALREGENINIFPIRGLNIPNPVVALNDASPQENAMTKAKTSEEKFKEEIQNSIERVSKKFTKMCRYISLKKIEIVNGSYGITFKNIMTKFRERHKELTGTEIDELKLKAVVDQYFDELYKRGIKTIQKYPKILFVFSAGNSALNNDQYHHYPSRIKLPNTITVAAMNGDYLASFSNYGKVHVDVGAPGVAILSLLPKVYSDQGAGMYSPSSGTSMAAPYVSNLAAQILNTNVYLTPHEIKRIILETGSEKLHLKDYLISSAVVDNRKALRAAVLSREMKLNEAINLAKLDLVPIEDTISIGQAPAVSAEVFKQKILDAVPSVITPKEVDEEPTIEEEPTKSSSSLQTDPKTRPRDNSSRPLLEPLNEKPQYSDPNPSSQTEAQSPTPSEEMPASSSQPESIPPPTQPQESGPSLPQS